MKLITGVAFATSVAVAALAPSPVLAQAYPSKPIRLVVPYAPGGGTDIISRAVALELSKTLGQAVNVDNRPGAGGNLGAEIVAKSAPDGYTLLTSASSLHGITPFLYKKLGYDPNKDLVPIIVLAGFANVLVVNPSLPAHSVKEYIALAKAQPGKVTCASSGSGSTIHMSCEMFKHMLSLEITHVPYKGSGPALTDLMGGQVNSMFDNIPSSITHIRSGKLRALGVAAEKRSSMLPQVPTFGEGGFAYMRAETWNGLFVPAGTSQAIVQRLHTEFARAIRAPEVEARFRELGAETVMNSQAEFTAQLRSEHERLGKLIRERKISAD